MGVPFPRRLTFGIARGDGRYARMLKSLARVQLLILDDWAITPLTAEQRRDLMEIVDDRHDRASTIVTSQVPVELWHEHIGNPTIADAVLDRIVHGAHPPRAERREHAKAAGRQKPSLTKPPPSSPTASAHDTHRYPAGIIGIPSWLQSEQVAGFDRNRWLQSSECAAETAKRAAMQALRERHAAYAGELATYHRERLSQERLAGLRGILRREGFRHLAERRKLDHAERKTREAEERRQLRERHPVPGWQGFLERRKRRAAARRRCRRCAVAQGSGTGSRRSCCRRLTRARRDTSSVSILDRRCAGTAG